MKRPFHSLQAGQMEAFVYSRKASGRWNLTDENNLHFFDNYCAERFPCAATLTGEMLAWCNKRPTENGNSCRSRIRVICNFVKYAREKGWTAAESPLMPSGKPYTYIPHAFTEEELACFFNTCDSYVMDTFKYQNRTVKKLNRLELPVYYRLLFSTGMRTCEARWLKRTDVGLVEGVININQSKGADQHRVALHESMRELLAAYDVAMDKVMPNRTCFFPDRNDRFRRPAWAEYHFRNIWKKVSKAPARPYDLRSHYAVSNVARWKDAGFELHDKLLYLSRTMGHRHLKSTCEYFNLSPVLADKIKTLTEESLNNLLPKLYDYEEYEK